MAVKKHELVNDNRDQLDLEALEQYIQLMNAQPECVPPPSQLVKNCQDIVKCLARTPGTEVELWELLGSVEEFFLRVVNNSREDAVRHDIITAILHRFYTFISDPQSDASPALSIVLVVLDTTNDEACLATARWLVQAENGPGGAGLRASLSCLYRWMSTWHGTQGLGDWILAYIKALEENDRYDILMETSLDNLAPLFLALKNPAALRRNVADVIFHVMACLRESVDALDRIAPYVAPVLESLADESGQWTRHLLQTLVDVLAEMVDALAAACQRDAGDCFREKYRDVISCLERHMASRDCRYLNCEPWRSRTETPPQGAHARIITRQVGLLNLGNTCYMNSVVQALLLTRPFSTHVMLKMTAVPYWSKMGILFAKMMYSIANKLNPGDFFTLVKPPFFTRDNQHDSSEFLGYLFELLQSYEHCSERNFDYSKPAVLFGANRARPSQASQSTSDNTNEAAGASNNSRAISPRPGSSAAGSSSGKRASPDELKHVPPKKRLRIAMNRPDPPPPPKNDESNFLRRDSYIDSMFGGVLLTRIECSVCHSSSLSRDVFRDLQLAFPEKPDNWKHSVQSLLEYYCSKEKLTGDNQYKCGDCGILRDAERSVVIETMPKFLILVLKTFKFSPKLQVQAKLMHSTYHNHLITLPTVRSQAEHSAYVLYAAVMHSGTTLDSGHYYTVGKDDAHWYTYNDDVVTLASENNLTALSKCSTPYILFYRRSDIEEGAAPSLTELSPKIQEAVLAHNKHYVDTVRNMQIARP